jgi:hypothetical protein
MNKYQSRVTYLIPAPCSLKGYPTPPPYTPLGYKYP